MSLYYLWGTPSGLREARITVCQSPCTLYSFIGASTSYSTLTKYTREHRRPRRISRHHSEDGVRVTWRVGGRHSRPEDGSSLREGRRWTGTQDRLGVLTVYGLPFQDRKHRPPLLHDLLAHRLLASLFPTLTDTLSSCASISNLSRMFWDTRCY